MHEFMILAQLSRRPMHGYMIAKIVGAMIGPFKQIQWGALYPVLSRLEHEGLIRAEEQEEGDGRPRKVYSLTEEGRERLHDHLMDTDRHLGEYFALFPLKVAFFHLLTPAERIRLARHYAVYAQQHLDHLVRKCREIEEVPMLTPEQRSDLLTTMEHQKQRWIRELAWAEELINREQILEAS